MDKNDVYQLGSQLVSYIGWSHLTIEKPGPQTSVVRGNDEYSTWRFNMGWLQYVASNISNNPQFDKLIIESHGFWRMRDVGQVPPLAAPLGQPAHGEG